MAMTVNDLFLQDDDRGSEIDKLLTKYYEELLSFKYEKSYNYAINSVANLYQDISELRAYLSRVEEIITALINLRAKLDKALKALDDSYTDKLNKIVLENCQNLVNKGWAYKERNSVYDTSTALLPTRVEMSKMSKLLIEVNSCLEVCISRKRYLEDCKKDMSLLYNFIRLGYNLREAN